MGVEKAARTQPNPTPPNAATPTHSSLPPPSLATLTVPTTLPTVQASVSPTPPSNNATIFPSVLLPPPAAVTVSVSSSVSRSRSDP